MSDLHDRFERLARRGSMRGGDAVLDAARRDADGVAVRGLDGRADDGATSGALAVEPITLQPASSRHRRRFGTAIAACGAAATLFVGSLAIGSLVGSGSGSDSPAGAVRQLADAVSHEDPIAAAAVLAPDEVRSLSATVSAAEQRAQTLALARRADAPLAGLDISVDGLDLATQSLGADYAKVTIAGGTIAARTDDGQFAPLMQRALHDTHGGSKHGHTNLATLAADDLPTFVMTVQRNGHWYVSAAYTALEYIREANDLSAADLGSGARAIATLGADTPDHAVSDALQALAHGDWAKLISLAPPDELPVYDYRAALEQLGARGDYTGFTIDHATTSATVDGSTAKVKLVASGTDHDGDPWSLDGACFSPPLPPDERSGAGPTSRCITGLFRLFPLRVNPFGGSDSSTFTVTEEHGRWFVSGVGTVLDLLDRSIADTSAREFYSALQLPQAIPPEGAMTLGHAVTFPESTDGFRVYTFQGHAGETIVATATPTHPPADGRVYFSIVHVYDPDGHDVGELGDDSGVPLRSDGTYLIVMDRFVETRVTLYDGGQQPWASATPRFPYGSSCELATSGAELCSENTSSSGPPPTVPGKSSSATSSTVPDSVP